MSALFSLGEIEQAVGGLCLQGDRRGLVDSVSINSRNRARRSLFIAIKGERFDGHNYLKEAVKAGASAVMISRRSAFRGLPASAGVILVPDTVKAMGQLAGYHRRRFKIPVIAVTGSAGKTTTKEWIAAVLSARYRVLKSARSENNHIGVPLTLFQLNRKHTACVAELGTSRPGDIDYLAAIVRPTVAVFTNIGESHLAGLTSLDGIFREKARLCRYLEPGQTVIYNSDDPYLKKISRRFRSLRLVSYGMLPGADYNAVDTGINPRGRRTLRLNGRHDVVLNSPVPAHVYAALSAVCCGRCQGIRYNDIKRYLNKVDLPAGRQELKRVKGINLINDTYNANPVSLRQALKTVQTLAGKGKKILVLADMLELGRRSGSLHDKAGRWAAAIGPDAVLTFGHQARRIGRKARGAGVITEHFTSRVQLHRRLTALIRPGDTVLVKGSRGMKMEETVRYLESRNSKI